MKTQTAIEFFGSRSSLARAVNVDPSATHHWGEFVPELRQYQIMAITRGRLKPDVINYWKKRVKK